MDNEPNRLRGEIARRVAAQKRAELGEHARAAAVYGSVAHGAASEYSDVEVIIVTDDTVEYRDDMLFEDGVMVECNIVPQSQLMASARRVDFDWGIKADEYRHQLVLWDPDGFFSKLSEAANDIPEAEFQKPLGGACWFWFYEGRTKTLAALAAHDYPRAVYDGWLFAYNAAMRIALHERKPYESGRTLWADVAARGYGMARLVEALTAGDVERLGEAVDVVWEETGGWGAPSG